MVLSYPCALFVFLSNICMASFTLFTKPLATYAEVHAMVTQTEAIEAFCLSLPPVALALAS